MSIFVLLMSLSSFAVIIPWCAKLGFDGIWKGETITPFRMKRVWLARLFGVLYIAYLMLILAVLPYLAGVMLAWSFPAVVAALGERFSMHWGVGWIWAGGGLFLIPMSYWGLQRRRKHDPAYAGNPVRQRDAGLWLYSHGIVLIAFGVYTLLGAPNVIVLLTWWVYLLVVAWPGRVQAALT